MMKLRGLTVSLTPSHPHHTVHLLHWQVKVLRCAVAAEHWQEAVQAQLAGIRYSGGLGRT